MYVSIKTKEEFLNYEKLKEKNVSSIVKNSIPFFGHSLLDKTVFIFTVLFDKPLFYVNEEKKYQEEINLFKEMIELLYHVFFKKKPNIKSIKINCKKVEDMMEHRKKHALLLFSNLYHRGINTFEEAEFLSFCFYMVHVLYACGYKTDMLHQYMLDKETKLNSTLKERVVHLLKTYKFAFHPTHLDSLFKKSTDISILNHYYGRFESGVKNIFKGCIPNNLSEHQLYQSIKQLNKEIIL